MSAGYALNIQKFMILSAETKLILENYKLLQDKIFKIKTLLFKDFKHIIETLEFLS